MTKHHYRISGIIAAGLLGVLSVGAQTVLSPQAKIDATSFAIFCDTQSFEQAGDDMQLFANQLGSENLPTFIVYDNWENPEQVKKTIRQLHKKHNLEGVLLVGDIPIAMIRKAQHMTSAFKMSESYPMRESSVPSDRFYDDFHLKFDFIKTDSADSRFFYYNLSATSPQQIKCDIYSARLKPVASGEPAADQLRRFFRKATAEHRAANKLDQFYSHTGEGSYSNSLNAWTTEAFTLREQMPGTFDSPAAPGRTRFTRYSFSDYPKDDIINQLKRDDLDLAIFHEHGVPHRQYISSTPETQDVDDHYRVMRPRLRELAARAAQDSARYATFEKTYTEMGLDPSWWRSYAHPDTLRADSILDARSGIMLTEITEFKPNARMVIFDACYNGDFREDDCIAARYIFAAGKTVATFGNSVNVLQDKQANELLGLLWMGARMGQWARETNILESHIHGDPTFRFTPSAEGIDASKICARPDKKDDFEKLLASPYVDLRCYAMHRLWRNNAAGLSARLRKIFLESPSQVERYTALSLLEKINDDNYRAVLTVALRDPNEFIRRTTVSRMGKVGLDEYVAPLVAAYFDDTQAERVVFQIENNIPNFSADAFAKAIANYSGPRAEKLKKAQERQASYNEGILSKDSKKTWRKLYIESLRNNPIHCSLNDYFALMADPATDHDVRLTMLEALAWYQNSYRAPEIIAACKEVMKSTKSTELKEQALRTINRLK